MCGVYLFYSHLFPSQINIICPQKNNQTAPLTKTLNKPEKMNHITMFHWPSSGSEILGPFILGKIRRELYHLYEHVLSNKTRLILDEMCRLYGKFASYLKTRLIFPRINGPIETDWRLELLKIRTGTIYECCKQRNEKFIFTWKVFCFVSFWKWTFLGMTHSRSNNLPERQSSNSFLGMRGGDPKNDFCLGGIRDHGNSFNHRMVDVQYEPQGS